MSIDLNFWKYQDGLYLDNAAVYEKACCEKERVEGLEVLPAGDILREIAAAFSEWTAPDLYSYERDGHGAFQISATPQTFRFDCYSMEPADMRRISAVLSRFGCPLYDPQLAVRFDRIHAFLTDEAGEWQTEVERAFSRLLPGLEVLIRTVTWDEYTRLSKTLNHIHYNAVIHRGKAMTKVTSFLQFGGGWTNRPCQCKTARLEDGDQARRILGELLNTSIERAVSDFLERTYYSSCSEDPS